MERAEVLRALTEKSLEGLKSLAYSLVWESENTFLVLRADAVLGKVEVRDYDFYSMLDMASSVYRAVFGEVFLTIEGSKEEQRIEGKRITKFDLFFSTADSDFYSEVKIGEIDKTICDDERKKIIVIERS